MSPRPTPAAQTHRAQKTKRRPGPQIAAIEGLHINHDNDNAIVSVAHDSFSRQKAKKADAVVSILGSSTSEGRTWAIPSSPVLGDSPRHRHGGPTRVVAVLGNSLCEQQGR